MDKSLKSQIKMYAGEKVKKLRKDAEGSAKGDYDRICSAISEGCFDMVETDQLEITVFFAGSLRKNHIYTVEYDKTLSNLIASQDLELLRVVREYGCQAATAIIKF